MGDSILTAVVVGLCADNVIDGGGDISIYARVANFIGGDIYISLDGKAS